MKYYYLLCFLISSFVINGQNTCDDANSYLVSAYSHVKESYKSNNISHLKYYANRAVESFKLSKETLVDCDCKAALTLSDDAIELLVKVEDAKTFEDGRFYVNRAKAISQKSVEEIDKCAYEIYSNKNKDVVDSSNQNQELSDLQNEQLKIKQQQEALKLKEEQIKIKLAQQKEKELMNAKQQLIISYDHALSSNVETYNETLKICECNKTIQNTKSFENTASKSIEDIKSYYVNNLKELSTKYLSELNSCQ